MLVLGLRLYPDDSSYPIELLLLLSIYWILFVWCWSIVLSLLLFTTRNRLGCDSVFVNHSNVFWDCSSSSSSDWWLSVKVLSSSYEVNSSLVPEPIEKSALSSDESDLVSSLISLSSWSLLSLDRGRCLRSAWIFSFCLYQIVCRHDVWPRTHETCWFPFLT